MKPSPRRIARVLGEAIEAHRDLFCASYDRCLDVAVKKDWPSWTCSGCPVRGTEQIRPEVSLRPTSVLGIASESRLADSITRAKGEPREQGTGRGIAMQRDILEMLRDGPLTEEELAEDYTPSSVRDALARMLRHGRVERQGDRYRIPAGGAPDVAGGRGRITQTRVYRAIVEGKSVDGIETFSHPKTVAKMLQGLVEAAAIEQTRDGWRITGRRKCRKCAEVKPLDSYAPEAGTWDGRSSRCRNCRNATARRNWKRRKT